MTFPNQLTVIRIILSPVFLFLALKDNPVNLRIAFIIYIIASLTDWYDGWYARKFRSVTKIGIFLDPFADKVLTTFAFIFFYIKEIMPLWMLILIAVRDLIITLLRSYDEYKGITLKTSFISKTKTFIQMTYIFVILGLMFISTLINNVNIKSEIADFLYNSPLNYALILTVTLITVYTGLDYVYQKIKTNEVNKNKENSR
ncbi:MAG: CDP-diacylglycerol--glycerol-3-phosphate 3-phosphatidyltransferase [Ignavibacteria bacterium]|nr:CDP-diacylglycerol--glycerol-3-phosphate 3-phosphatidyltransferase [Ignavibacteria bacterium]